jgi:hypothetical protein
MRAAKIDLNQPAIVDARDRSANAVAARTGRIHRINQPKGDRMSTFEQIKDRKGHLRADGVFVKDAA